MNQNNKLHSRTAVAKLALLGAALIWGSSFFVFKIAVDSIPPNFALAVRFSIACITLSIIFHKRLKRLKKDVIKCGAAIGFFLFIAYSSQTLGLTDTTPGKNAFLTAIYCVIVPFLFWFVNKSKPDIYNFSAAFLCIAGIGFVSLTESLTIGLGDALTLLGGFLFAAHMVAIAKLGKDRDPVLITLVQFGFAALFAWIAALIFEPFPAKTAWSPEVMGGLLYLSFICTAVALLLQNIGQKYTHPASASIILSLESVFGVLFSILFYGEAMTFRLFIGFLLIFIAIIISETKLSFLSRKA